MLLPMDPRRSMGCGFDGSRSFANTRNRREGWNALNYNKVLLAGNLTRDPELRYVGSSGNAVCELRLAVNRKFKRQDGEYGEETCFVDIKVWGSQGENCNEYLKKGSGVFVEGRLTLETWDGQDGQKRSKHRVVAERVQFMPRGGGGGPRRQEGPPGDEVTDFGGSYQQY